MSRPVPASPSALDPLLSIDDLARVLNCGRRSVERMLSSGQLPRPDLRLGRMPRWRAVTVQDWIDGQVAGRGKR